MLSAGHYEQDADGCMEAVMEALSRMARDASLREELSKRASKLVDGKGAERLARALLRLDHPLE
jgi:hypothetical protein